MFFTTSSPTNEFIFLINCPDIRLSSFAQVEVLTDIYNIPLIILSGFVFLYISAPTISSQRLKILDIFNFLFISIFFTTSSIIFPILSILFMVILYSADYKSETAILLSLIKNLLPNSRSSLSR